LFHNKLMARLSKDPPEEAKVARSTSIGIGPSRAIKTDTKKKKRLKGLRRDQGFDKPTEKGGSGRRAPRPRNRKKDTQGKTYRRSTKAPAVFTKKASPREMGGLTCRKKDRGKKRQQGKRRSGTQLPPTEGRASKMPTSEEKKKASGRGSGPGDCLKVCKGPYRCQKRLPIEREKKGRGGSRLQPKS